jgi:hypothetical protein
MQRVISRRNFIKTSSIAGVAAAVTPVVPVLAETSASKSRVVIVKDPDVYASNKVDETRLIAMFDRAVMTLTGKTDIGAAYEAMFPNGVTASTKILMKRNDISGKGTVNTAVTNAFKKALGKMLGGTFPAANIEIHCQGVNIKSKIQNCTYLINCPVCWMHGSDYGVTLSLKNTMIYLNNASVYHSADKKWLHEVSLDPVVKPKQVFSLLDALVGNQKSGPGSSATFEADTIIMSKDIVAVDYQALRLLEKQSSPNTNQIKTGDAQLVKAQTAGLGTCTPANMEVITLTAPFTTGIIEEHASRQNRLDLDVVDRGGAFDFILPGGTIPAEMAVFDMKGNLVWKSRPVTSATIVWDKRTAMGTALPAGMYTYRIKQNNRQVKGVVFLKP